MTEPPTGPEARTSEPAAAELRRGSFGAWLRHQREARSVSLREIADASKISLRYLDALEQDRFDVLPAPVFARGFLREYARVVGLNPDEVVNLFLVALEDRPGGAPRSEPARAPRQRRSNSNVGYGLLLALAVIAFLAVAAALSFYVERKGEAAPAASSFVAPAPPAAPAPAPAVEAPAPVTDPATAVGAVEAAPAPQATSLQLVLSFREDCWVETVVDGRRRNSELRAGGETVAIEAEESVLLTLGNAAAVGVEVNGRPFALPESGGRVVRSLRIDRAAAGLAPAPAAGSPPATTPDANLR
jgi:cytoskeletal protein RodZ